MLVGRVDRWLMAEADRTDIAGDMRSVQRGSKACRDVTKHACLKGNNRPDIRRLCL